MTLMFDENSINETTVPLIKALRQAFYEKQITEAEFIKRYRAAGRSADKPKFVTDTEIRELIQTTLKDTRRLSYGLFNRLMRATFGDFAIEVIFNEAVVVEPAKRLLFNKADIAKATHPLGRRMRQMCYDARITVAEFDRRFREASLREGVDEDHIQTHSHNILRALAHTDDMTMRLFEYITKMIFGLKVVGFRITLNDTVYYDTTALAGIRYNAPVTIDGNEAALTSPHPERVEHQR
jgi:hypothetical protein